ncbi:MAG: hypothetical protein HRT66_09490 [Flavobacteriaceae bacterium]|nr:hypothetical protein [Flavobacteriaceae bacterium]
MKNIHFHILKILSLESALLIFSIILIFGGLGLYSSIDMEYEEIGKQMSTYGFLLQAVFHSRMFWFRNTVQYNKLGMVIRIKSFFGKSITFSRVEKVELNENQLVIYRFLGKIITIDMSDITKEDSYKLYCIIIEKSEFVAK